MIKLQLSPAEREHLEGSRGLTIDVDGDETLRGLNLAESIEYLDLRKRQGPRDSKTRLRFLELHERYDFARKSVIVAEAEARFAGAKH